jgi:hypothetical protein
MKLTNKTTKERPMRLERMWINQPSTFQPHHSQHGVCVLADIDDQTFEHSVRVYYLSGSVVSEQVPKLELSLGWPEETGRANEAYKQNNS